MHAKGLTFIAMMRKAKIKQSQLVPGAAPFLAQHDIAACDI